MTAQIDHIRQLGKDARSALDGAQDAEALEEWRIEHIGRKGKVSVFLRTIKDLPAAEKKSAGHAGNQLRADLNFAYQEKKRALLPIVAKTLPPAQKRSVGHTAAPGHLHPLTLARERVEAILTGLGFAMVEGPEVEEVLYAFDLLNMPADHPARAMTDTFYVHNKKTPTVLRQHTSSVQLRAVREEGRTPPIRIFSPGRVFRAERTDATHETTFYQFEGLVIEEGATIASFKGVIESLYSQFFNNTVTSRLRPSYFPFVEPGFEVDISCVFCQGDGCRVCKHTGWIEVMGAGMVHPEVLKNMNIDPRRHQGYAFGGAIDRITMLRHGINDIRLFWSGDIRFLKQFS